MDLPNVHKIPHFQFDFCQQLIGNNGCHNLEKLITQMIDIFDSPVKNQFRLSIYDDLDGRPAIQLEAISSEILYQATLKTKDLITSTFLSYV